MKKIVLKVIALMIILIVLLQLNYQALAVSQQQIDDLENQKDSNSDAADELEEQKEAVEAEKNEILKQVESLSNQISDYEYQIMELEEKLDDLNNQIANQEEELVKKEEEYIKQQELYESRLIAIYEQGETSYLDVILQSDSITEMVSNYYLISELARNDSEMLDMIQKQKEDIENIKKELETNKAEVVTAKAEIEGVATELKSAKAEKDKQVAQLSAEEQAIQANLDEYNESSKAIEAQIAKLEKELAEQNKPITPPASGGNVVTGSGTLQKPVTTGYVSATWYYPSGGYHGAIDYALPSGNPIYAAADGIVVATGNLSYGYGTYVVIRHTSIGLETWYAHGTKGSISVSVGQSVSRGQKIMLSGNTGNSTGPHLHFEARTSPYYTSNRVYPPNYY